MVLAMTVSLSRVDMASDWREYQGAYQELYTEILTERCCLGRATFESTVHHSVIPDAMGSPYTRVNWAAYSQPSSETMRHVLSATKRTLAQSHEMKHYRYLFFIPRGSCRHPETDLLSNSRLPYRFDYWSGSFESLLSLEPWQAVLASNNLLFGTSQDFTTSIDLSQESSPRRCVAYLVDYLKGFKVNPRSTVPPLLQPAMTASSAIIAGMRLGLEVDDIINIQGSRLWLAARIALKRISQSSGGVHRHQDQCEQVIKALPTACETHIVLQGDTLSRITRSKYGLSFSTLEDIVRELNPTISDLNKITTGQKIRLPVL